MANKGKTSEKTSLSKLFFTMIYISTFTFGGGFVIINFMRKKFVEHYNWISEEEMLDFIVLAQSSPGAIAVNAAILVGWRVAGFLGMIIAIIGTILPPTIILSIISFFYEYFISNPKVSLLLKGMQAGVAALILDVVFSMGKSVVKGRSKTNLIIMILAFIATFVSEINVIFIILFALSIGVIKAIFTCKKEKSI